MMIKSARRSSGFIRFLPIINFIFFVVAIVLTMVYTELDFLLVSLLAAFLYYAVLAAKKALQMIPGMIAVIAIVTIINVIFSMALHGKSELYVALAGGIRTGLIFACILTWFACYNIIMTADRFSALFSARAPALTLLLSMILRMVPLFQKKTEAISGARKCIGKGEKSVKNAGDVISILATWALEGAIVTADSMKSRGYGAVQRRTNFISTRARTSDWVLSLLMASVLALTLIFKNIFGYAIFLLIPAAIDIWEEIRWHTSVSKI